MSNIYENVKGKLGFGLMRLPKLENGEFDLPQICKMVDRFLESGFSYFDTAFVYDGSEEAMKKALVERYPRESFQVASKCAAWAGAEDRAAAIKQLESTLERSGLSYLDYYLLHNMGGERTHFFDDYDLWDWISELKKDGIVKHIGFSAHCSPEELEEIFIKHPEMEFVQLQINYFDWDNPSVKSRECYEIARKYNKPIIVMEPVKGGILASLPPVADDILKATHPDATPASWAIRYAASLPGVQVVLSGMSTIDQLDNNVSFMKEFEALSENENDALQKALSELKKIPSIPCTNCYYCAKVCPCNIGIPESFTAYNILATFGNMDSAKHQQSLITPIFKKANANECVKCGKCESACPQHILIRDELDKVTEAFNLG